MKKIALLLLLILLITGLIGCSGNGNNKEEKGVETNTSVTPQNKQLNITLLLDLSDRIEPDKYPAVPAHSERDIAAVKEIVNVFKEDMRHKGNFKMKGKMKVLFSPVPENPEINQIANKLNIDTKPLNPAEKTELYKNIYADFEQNLTKIYETTLQTKKYVGSDIWRFFKNDVKDLAMQEDEKQDDKITQYRNILVLITDGYIFHVNTKMKEANRYSYITPELIQANKLNNENWKKKIEDLDFGLINPRSEKDLSNLEVIVLEVNPSKSRPYEEDILKEVLGKWFKEMGISKYAIYQTDIPENTKLKIKNFFNIK
ncbi:hypothetical protein [Riemerella columbipharyngis]|uniref:Uncharacterized protein n=1 Tax=Riemerella columbipharyngis TaxID=1071918 RepID=A0A1G7BAJ4_9FLAO|nr:hypothetical protein [Riemerella columbipharyngis]SDE24158.1 hypothetical protein SAMN05421544_10595 [Riemerella columbipharyngis]